MQTTEFRNELGELEELEEVFTGKSQEQVTAMMNDRLMELQEKGHTLKARRLLSQQEVKKFTRAERKAFKAMRNY